MMRMGLAYLKYRTRAKNRHGVHSPFVYDLVEHVINSGEIHRSAEIEAIRSKLKSDTRSIEITDLGAGSRTGATNKRQVKRIAANSATPQKLAAMLQRLVSHYKLENILELGTNLGLTTAYLAASPAAKKVVSVEGDPQLADLSRKNLNALHIQADVRCGDFNAEIPRAIADLGHIDFAYLDGNHRKAPTLSYFERLLPALQNHSIIAIGDIHWSAEMEEAWAEIQAHPAARTTIDLFYIGLVFFRKELSPEHFILRFP